MSKVKAIINVCPSCGYILLVKTHRDRYKCMNCGVEIRGS